MAQIYQDVIMWVYIAGLISTYSHEEVQGPSKGEGFTLWQLIYTLRAVTRISNGTILGLF